MENCDFFNFIFVTIVIMIKLDISDLSSSSAQILAIIRNYINSNIFTSAVVEVTAVNGNKVDVQFINQFEKMDGTKQESIKVLDVLVGVIGDSNWSLSFPISVGDIGLLITSKFNLDEYKKENGKHYKLDEETKEIKTGLGDLNGKKLEKKNTRISKAQAESESKIKELDKIDFTKEAILPTLPKWVMDKYNLKDKPIKLKQNIVKRNQTRHPDISICDYKKIIGLSLYNPNKVFKSDKNNYLCFIGEENKKKFTDVVLDIQETLENYEIVHFYWLNDKKLNKIEKRDVEI